MADGVTEPPNLRLVGQPEKSTYALRAELEALRYENQKLRVINDVLVQRVELGWGNFSTAYSSFERAAMLTEQVASKARELQQAQSQLDETQLHLASTQSERDLSQRRLLDLIETIPDAVSLFDENRVLVFANASFFEFWRDTEANIELGKTRLAELGRLAISYGLFDRRQRASERAQPGGPTTDSVFRMADGRWLQMAERPTEDGSLVVVYTDITRVKTGAQTEKVQVVREQDALLEDLLQNLPEGVALVERGGQIRATNTRFRELLGIDRGQLPAGIALPTLLESTQLGEVLGDPDCLWGECEHPSKGCQRELRLPDASVMELTSRPLKDGGYLVTFADVTRRSRDAQLIRDTSERLRFMTDALPALIAYINSDLVFEFANQSFEDWYDRPRDQVEGAVLTELLGPEEAEKHEQYVGRVLAGQPVSFEVEQGLPDGRRQIFNKSYVPHRNEEGDVIGFFALEQDVTEQRRTASALKYAYRHMEQRVFERTRELSDLNDQLQAEVEERAQIERHLLEATHEARQASESKVKFMAAAGHDLLQPLNAARLFGSAMMDEDLDPRIERLATSLTRSLDDVESIITTLVDISKLEAGVVEAAPESFALSQLFSTLSDEFSVVAKEAGLEFRCHPSSAVVYTDSQLLSRILRNLLTNAVRYTDEGRIVLGCRRRAEGVDIEVADTGIGIPEDKLDLIFGEFQRVEDGVQREERGLGLGLAIVEKLCGVLGSRISVRSLPARGSVFRVFVPYGTLERQPEKPTDVAELVMPEQLEGRRILVVDNEPDILEGMQTLLDRWGCEVVTARGLAELDDHLRDGFTPDLAILDYQLDDNLTGFAVATVLADRLDRMPPVLMITANYTKELSTEVSRSGFTLMNKPVRPHKLRATMTRLLTASMATP